MKLIYKVTALLGLCCGLVVLSACMGGGDNPPPQPTTSTETRVQQAPAPVQTTNSGAQQ